MFITSSGGHPAVDDHHGTYHGGCFVRGEICCHCSDLFGGDEAAVRLADLHLSPCFFRVVVAGRYTGDPGRIHGVRSYAIDPYPFFYVVYRRGPAEREDAALSRAP